MSIDIILKKPLITEKLNRLTETRGQYSFMVDKKANKDDIKAAIEKFYNVEVVKLNTMICRGKSRKNRKTGLVTGRNNSYKKAICTLKEGNKIDFYESI